jgi:hypothetical protein
MTHQISAKFAALGIALMMNLAMMGALTYLFNAQAIGARAVGGVDAGGGVASKIQLAAV